MTTDPVVEFDPLNPAVRDNPYPIYRSLLSGGLHHSEFDGHYTVARHADVMEVLRRHDVFSNVHPPGTNPLGSMEVLVTADEPKHRIHRRLVAKAFTPTRVAQLRPTIEAEVTHLIDQFAGRGTCDIVEEFAYQLPINTIARLFGVPADDREKFRQWSDDFFVAFGDLDNPKAMDAGIETVVEFSGYILERADERREILQTGADAPDDLLTALIIAEEDGETLTEEEFVIISLMLMNAGHETTTKTIGNALHLLCTHPEELKKLQDDPSLVEAAIEETLRFESPVQFLWRTVKEDAQIAGGVVPKGDRLRWLIAAANRDPEVWADPDDFRIDRDLAEIRQHVSFGSGIHFCAGASLGRLQGQIAISQLIDRLPGLALDPHRQNVRSTAAMFRGWSNLHLRWDPPDPEHERGP